jgi:hypothetical protein
MGIAMNPIRLEAKEVLDAIRLRDEANHREILNRPGCSPCDPARVTRTGFPAPVKLLSPNAAPLSVL